MADGVSNDHLLRRPVIPGGSLCATQGRVVLPRGCVVYSRHLVYAPTLGSDR